MPELSMEPNPRYEKGLWSIFMRLLFIDLFLKCCLVNNYEYLHYLGNMAHFFQVSYILLWFQCFCLRFAKKFGKLSL